MKGYRIALCVVIAVACVFALAAAAFADDHFSGAWRVNLAKSTYSPGLPPKSMTSTITVTGDTMSFTFDGYDGDGKALLLEELSVKVDGKDYPVKGDPIRDTTAMKKIDDYTLEQVNKKDGKVTTITRTVYNPDGKSRIATTTGTDAQGRKINNIVFSDKR